MGVEVDALAVGASRGHGVVGLHLAAAHGGGERVVLEGVGEDVLVVEMEPQGRRFGNGGGDGGFHVEEVLADGAHAALGLRHLVEFLGGLQVLAGDVHLFTCQQQTEIEVDCLHSHLLRLCEEARLRLAVAQRLYAAVPLQVVHAEERLREGDGHGQRHELILRPAAARLVQIVERRLHRERTTRGPQLLRDVHRAIQSEVVVTHERQ